MAALGSVNLSGEPKRLSIRHLGELDRTSADVPAESGERVADSGVARYVFANAAFRVPRKLTCAGEESWHWGRLFRGFWGAADQNCNTAQAPPDNQKNLIICEEVRENGATQDYITSTVIWNRNGQKQLAASHANIQFPKPSIEVKADWIQLSSIGFDCANLPASLRQSAAYRDLSTAIASQWSGFT